MCMSCALRSLQSFNSLAGGSSSGAVHVGAPATPSTNGTGVPGPLQTGIGDNVADNTSTTSILTVGAAETVSTINTIGDKDFFRIQLEAGKTYEIGMFAKAGGPTGMPLIDSYIELYDAAGTFITAADGGASTQVNTANSGFDAILTFVPQQSGTYFVNARAFDNLTQDGPDGDLVGDYSLTATDVTGQPVYQPYYDVDSPLHSLDWGSEVDGTVRNPDGAESGHITGNPAGTPDNKGFTGTAHEHHQLFIGRTLSLSMYIKSSQLSIRFQFGHVVSNR